MRPSFTLKLAPLLLLPALSGAVIVEDFKALPATEYDFVIVGATDRVLRLGGTGGMRHGKQAFGEPFAQYLAHRSWAQVSPFIYICHIAVVSNGLGSGDGVLDMMVPAYVTSCSAPNNDWGYKTVPQVGLNNRIDPVVRGHALGGSSSISQFGLSSSHSSNLILYRRNDLHKRLLGRLQSMGDLTGDEGWSWDNILPYFLKVRFLEFHSTEGIVGVSLPGYPQAMSQPLREAAEEVGFVYDQDVNDGVPLGVGNHGKPMTIGMEQGAALPMHISHPTTLLEPTFMLWSTIGQQSCSRLSFKPRRKQISLLFERSCFNHNNSTTSVNVTATKEVILSGGAYGTPQLLLLSGIGNATELEGLGIQPTVDLPSVGKNLTDHPLPEQRDVPTRDSRTMAARQDRTLDKLFHHLYTWHRLPDTWPFWAEYDDPSAGSNSPHLEIMPTALEALPLLGSPLIDLGLITTEFDIRALRQGVADMKGLFTADAWADWGLVPTGPLGEATSDEQVYQAIRNLAGNAYHPISTAMMTPEDASYGVV
ncbi:aryl-alcohol oxidase [Coprinopsis sp. MPI-PUGE-AT-0042]|nr:aryl-alcohol oxidase [Coprinopsis sp. MPI-PUGE-AT-0042]